MTKHIAIRGIVVAACTGLITFAAAQAHVYDAHFSKSTETVNSDGVPVLVGADFVATVQPEVINVDLRDLPVVRRWQPGDPVVTIPKRRGEPEIKNPQPVNPVTGPDPLLARQRAVQNLRGGGFTTPLLNEEGDNSGSNPHDPNGEVGIDYFVQAINGSGGTQYTFYNKSDGTVAAGPFTLSDLATSGPCTGGLGDPILLFDELASRWVLTEFSSSGNRMCVYVAQTADPIAGGWFAYDFQAPSFPDYPKYGVWPDAYYVGTNEASSTLYAFERDQMLAGGAADMQRFTISDPSAFGFAMIPPVDHDGTNPPPMGEPGIFIRHYDDEAHSPGSNDPSSDLLQIWEFNVDWVTPANSSLTGPIDIEIAEIDSEQCGFTAFECYPQPGTTVDLDPLREVVMNLPKYRNFGSHESLVGNLVTDVDGTDHGGVRWFELRRSGGGWALHQEGTFAPDIADGAGATEHRWMAGSAIDETGNIAIGFNLSNDTNIFPSLTYSGRLVSDPSGVLTFPETTIVDGTASHTTSTRWGDYSSMSVDPVDGCTFWFTSNYGSTGTAPTAATRFASFKFDACGMPTFTLAGDNTSQLACVEGGSDPLDDVNLEVGSVEGFTNTVSLAYNPPLPAGFTGGITPSMVTPQNNPPASAVADLTVAGGTTAGDYTVTVEGTATGTDPKTLDVAVNVADMTPPATTLISPADDALNVDPAPIFSWDASAQANSYDLEVATDPSFTSVVISETVAATSFQPSTDLNTSTEYFWRVTPSNQCGVASASSVFSFTTQSAPGDCSPGSVAVEYYSNDMESGDAGWTHNAATGTDTWDLNETDANSPTFSWQGMDIEVVSDQRLVTPEITMPSSPTALTLQYYGKRDLEENTATSCYDGGILEFSTNGGSSWTQVDSGMLDTNPYTGPVSTDFMSPIAGQNAWCDMQDWTRTVVDLTGFEGQDVMFRFRLATDESLAADDWHIDDFVVQSCETEEILIDGFEDPAL